jgi:hypothetical protein
MKVQLKRPWDKDPIEVDDTPEALVPLMIKGYSQVKREPEHATYPEPHDETE